MVRIDHQSIVTWQPFRCWISWYRAGWFTEWLPADGLANGW